MWFIIKKGNCDFIFEELMSSKSTIGIVQKQIILTYN